jgi:hypothetical protein
MPCDLQNVAFGTIAPKLAKVVIWRFSSVSEVTAVVAIGTSCTLVAILVPTTMISLLSR